MQPGTFLTPVNGDVVLSTANQVYEAKDVHGCIDVRGANVTIRNVRVTGPCFYGISTDNAATGTTTITHVEVNCTDGHGSALNGPHYAASFGYLHNCENGAEINQGSSITDSYIDSREATTAGHGDGIQSQGGNNVVIRHNTFASLNPVTSSIITNPTANNGWVIEDNFLSAGAFTLYCPEQGTNFTVRNNRFYPWRILNPDGVTYTKLYKGEDSNGVPLPGSDLHAAAFGLVDACNHTGINWSGNFLDNTLVTVPATGA